MSTLNARANQAYRKYMEGSGADWYGFDHESAAFEEGWETGYKTRQAELPTREQIEQRIRRVYIDGGAHVVVAQEAATEIAGALLKLMGGES